MLADEFEERSILGEIDRDGQRPKPSQQAREEKATSREPRTGHVSMRSNANRRGVAKHSQAKRVVACRDRGALRAGETRAGQTPTEHVATRGALTGSATSSQVATALRKASASCRSRDRPVTRAHPERAQTSYLAAVFRAEALLT